MIVAAQVPVDHGASCLGAHAERSDNVTGTLHVRAVVHLADTQSVEYLLMRCPRSRKAGLNVAVDPVGEARQGNAVDIPLVRIERHPVCGIRKLFDK